MARVEPPGTGEWGGLSSQQIAEMAREVDLEIKRLEVRKRERVEASACGELAPIEDFQAYWASRCSALHAALRALPDRVAKRAGSAYEAVHGDAVAAVENALEPFAGGLDL